MQIVTSFTNSLVAPQHGNLSNGKLCCHLQLQISNRLFQHFSVILQVNHLCGPVDHIILLTVHQQAFSLVILLNLLHLKSLQKVKVQEQNQ